MLGGLHLDIVLRWVTGYRQKVGMESGHTDKAWTQLQPGHTDKPVPSRHHVRSKIVQDL
jgi:hypothetical protein